ncbi:MAG: hypothetical protein M3Z13_00085 [Candidatus Dormibacteraeota bacterium]|nr:hypothetical protein [Candidatus Dormibacteraeota bacterium]
MTLLRVSPSGQVYDVALQQLKVTRDEGGGYYLHGKGHFMFFEDREAAEAKKRDIEVYGVIGGLS